MTRTEKNMLIGSTSAAISVLLATILDLFTSYPFSHQVVLDVCFAIGAVLILFMSYESWRELA